MEEHPVAGRETHQDLGEARRDTANLRKLQLPEKESDAKHRAIETQTVDDLYKTYGDSLTGEQVKRLKQIELQVRGMDIFDHAEIRTGMKLSDKDVKALRSAYEAAAKAENNRIQAELKAKRITPQQAAKAASNFTFSVPDKVRDLLSRDQRAFLDDLLGEKRIYR